MKPSRWLVGMAALSVVVSGAGSRAQDAAGAAAAPASDCSGIGCLLNWRSSPHPDEGQARAAEEAARAAPGGEAAKAPASAAAKPAHVITIVAEGSEIPRLKRLAAALPKEKIKIVTARAGSKRAATDLSVSADLAASGTEKAKLFTEQMHVLAGTATHSIADLDGKVVSFGPDKSSSQAAARKAFASLNVSVRETPLDVENALDGLSTGDIDAVVILAPQPVERLKTLSAPGVHLLSWPEGGSLPEGASAVSIDATAYPGLTKAGDRIGAMGVDATLNISDKAAKQPAVKSFLKSLSDHSGSLAKRGFDLLKADLGPRKRGVLASADRS